ncbi:MAG: Lcl C-terminal domain-containing protein [Candidatus Hermodarchaeia archaeon]|jgi:hypothetical protein
MVKKTRITIILTWAVAFCFAIMAVGSNTVFADEDIDLVIKKLNQSKRILKNRVLPRIGGVPKTGQVLCFDDDGYQIPCSGTTGQDGDTNAGVPWPDPRFTDNGDGTIADNLTGFMWLKDANCIQTNYPSFDNDNIVGDGLVTWYHALDFVAGINDGTYADCGAGHTDWRLPNLRELHSIVHYGVIAPTLPNTTGTGKWTQGDPFTNVVVCTSDDDYWSSTTMLNNQPASGDAYVVEFCQGQIDSSSKRGTYGSHVWAVRGPN